MSIDIMHELAQQRTDAFTRGMEIGLKAAKSGDLTTEWLYNTFHTFGTYNSTDACEVIESKGMLPPDAVDAEANYIAMHLGVLVAFEEAGGQV